MDVENQDSSAPEISESSPVDQTPADSFQGEDSGGETRQGKRVSGYSRAKRQRAKWEEERKTFESERQQFQAERAQLMRERQEFEQSKKPKNQYTVEEMQGYKEQWQEELEALQGEPYPNDLQKQQIGEVKKLLRKADKEIERMTAEQMAERNLVELPRVGTQQHANIWHQCETELRKQYPDFQKPGTRLDTVLREIFAGPDGEHYRSHPRGIYAAVSAARERILTEDNQKLKAENQQLRALTSISGGISTRPGINGDTRPFERLSSKEMRERLLKGPRSPVDSMHFM